MDPRSMTYLPTLETYTRWAPTYDTDGNFLQALDSLLVPTLLSSVAPLLPPAPTVLDLGCGTGRTTLSLLEIPGADILGVDNCVEMLEIARKRLKEKWMELDEGKGKIAKGWEVKVWDIENGTILEGNNDETSETRKNGKEEDEKDGKEEEEKPILLPTSHFHLITSTLVLEHIPSLSHYFGTCSSLLREGSFLLLTNMHNDMSKAGSQAGFTISVTGEKVRGVSFFHNLEDVLEEAGKWGFEVHWGPEEREVKGEDLGVLGKRAERWEGVRVWWGVVFRKVGEGR